MLFSTTTMSGFPSGPLTSRGSAFSAAPDFGAVGIAPTTMRSRSSVFSASGLTRMSGFEASIGTSTSSPDSRPRWTVNVDPAPSALFTVTRPP